MRQSRIVFCGVCCSFFTVLIVLSSCTFNRSQEERTKAALDKKGGIEITMQIDIPYFLDVLSGYNATDLYQNTKTLAIENSKNSHSDFLSLFFDAFDQIASDAPLASIFASYEMRDKVNVHMSNYEVEQVLVSETEAVIANTINMLRSRLERGGYKEACVKEGNRLGLIVIEIPAVTTDDSLRLTRYLQAQGDLGFWETYEFSELLPALGEITSLFEKLQPSLSIDGGVLPGPFVGYALWKDTMQINQLLASQEAKSVLPRDVRFVWNHQPIGTEGDDYFFQLMALKAQRNGCASLSGDVITDARAVSSKQPASNKVILVMNTEGARKWQRLTRENIGKCIAIVIDGEVCSCPVVCSEISDGLCEITGNFNEEGMNELVNIILAGKMPTPVRIIMENDIKPKK